MSKSYSGFEVFFPVVKNRVKLMYEIRRITKLGYQDVTAACSGNYRINIAMFYSELCELRDRAGDYANIGCRQTTIEIKNISVRPYLLKIHRKRYSHRTRTRLAKIEEAHLREIYGDEWKDHVHYNYYLRA